MVKIHLSKLLGERRWTQRTLAQKTGIRPTTVGEYYHELVERVNLNYISAICTALNCSIVDLLEFVPDDTHR